VVVIVRMHKKVRHDKKIEKTPCMQAPKFLLFIYNNALVLCATAIDPDEVEVTCCHFFKNGNSL